MSAFFFTIFMYIYYLCCLWFLLQTVVVWTSLHQLCICCKSALYFSNIVLNVCKSKTFYVKKCYCCYWVRVNFINKVWLLSGDEIFFSIYHEFRRTLTLLLNLWIEHFVIEPEPATFVWNIRKRYMIVGTFNWKTYLFE